MAKLLGVIFLVCTLNAVSMSSYDKTYERKLPPKNQILYSYASLLNDVNPSIVNVHIYKQSKEYYSSGVIISHDGYIITTHHLLEGAFRVNVKLFNDGEVYEAKMIGRDISSNIALLKIEKQTLLPLDFFDSHNVKLGDIVLAVAKPTAMMPIVSRGVISSINKKTAPYIRISD
jgi:S1-C subfamily serine protease